MADMAEEMYKRLESLELKVADLNVATKDLRDPRYKQPISKFGIYSAICISTMDIWKQNRVQWFSPIFDDPTSEVSSLPWALPISSFGGFDDSGSSWIPPAGSTVIIAFEGGNNGAAYYLGTTWCRERGPGSLSYFNTPIEEFNQLYAGKRNGYLCGPNDGSQVFPPWNTESYNGYDIDSISQLSKDQSILTRATYPNIYGFKTPEKHMMKMVDGDARCNRKWKRIEIMSGCGNWMIFKDDHLHYAGQWAHPTCANNQKDGDTSCIVGLPNPPVYDINNASNGQTAIDMSGNSTNTNPDLNKKSENTDCAYSNDSSTQSTIIGGKPETQERPNSQNGRNPFFKQASECRPYRGPQTPQNNKCDLPQTGVQILSISGHTLVMDDSVNQPRGSMDWNRSTQAFDFGCDNKFAGRTYWKSTTGHLIEMNDLERTDSGSDMVRGDSNGIKLHSALGNEIFLCDAVDGPNCDGRASAGQGIIMTSTSKHQFIMSDEGNKREYGCRQDGALPQNNANAAYMQLRTGYGLQITLNDSPDQQATQGQSIDIIAPQKTIENGSRPHIIQLQEGYPDVNESGYIQVRSGGNLFLYAKENALEVIEGHKIIYVKTNRLDYTEEDFFHIGRKNHVVKVDEKIFLLAGRDYKPPSDTDNNKVSPPENLLQPELDQATAQATTNQGECVPGIFPILVLMPNGCIKASDRVYASCSNSATGIGIGNLNIEACAPGDDQCSGGLPLS
jgi:hypothetical protein